MADALRVALIGTGRIGRVHAATLARTEGVELAVVCDVDVVSAGSVAAAYGGSVATDPGLVIGSADVEAVVIASPTSTHVDLLAMAVEAGVPALCEKPIDLDIGRVDALRERAAAATAPVMVGFNRRFDPHFAALHARVAAGEIGRLEHLAITSRDPAPPPVGYLAVSGGLFRDMTIHDLDMARWFVPDIVSVTATGLHQFDEDIAGVGDYDAAVLTLVGARGESVVITNSRHSAYGYDQRLEAFGPDGLLSVCNVTDTVVRFSGATASELGDPFQNFFLERYAAAYARELAAFVSAVRGEDVTVPGFEDGRAALLLADAAVVSAREGRRVDVDLG